jgi:hypothetical protein
LSNCAFDNEAILTAPAVTVKSSVLKLATPFWV